MAGRYEAALGEMSSDMSSDEAMEVDHSHPGNKKTKAVVAVAFLAVLAVGFARMPLQGGNRSAAWLRAEIDHSVVLSSNSTPSTESPEKNQAVVTGIMVFSGKPDISENSVLTLSLLESDGSTEVASEEFKKDKLMDASKNDFEIPYELEVDVPEEQTNQMWNLKIRAVLKQGSEADKEIQEGDWHTTEDTEVIIVGLNARTRVDKLKLEGYGMVHIQDSGDNSTLNKTDESAGHGCAVSTGVFLGVALHLLG